MAEVADRRTLVLALSGAGLGVLLTRFPLASASSSPWFGLLALASFALLGLPILIAEGALGQYRRRNAVDAYRGGWRFAGFAHAAGAVALASFLAIVAGFSARFLVGSLDGWWFDDPARHFRLYSEGPDTLLWTLGVLAVVTGMAVRGVGRGLRGAVGTCAVLALLLLGGLAVWANLQEGGDAGRDALTDFDTDVLDASFVVRAVLAGLLPALLATGIATTLAGQAPSRSLPRELGQVALFSSLGLVAALFFLGPLAAGEGVTFGDGGFQAFTQVAAVFGAIGSYQGGFLAGCFFGALLLAAVVGLLALLEVPATWLAESYASWTETHGQFAAGLVAFLVAVPFCFSLDGLGHLGETLAWVVAPLAGLLVSLHVGWARPEVLDGFRVGDAGHSLQAGLKPALRFVLAPAFLALLLFGVLGLVQAFGGGGPGGLWDLAP